MNRKAIAILLTAQLMLATAGCSSMFEDTYTSSTDFKGSQELEPKLMSRTGSFVFPTNRKMRITEILEIIKMAIACLITTTEVRLPQEVAVIKIALLREAAT